MDSNEQQSTKLSMKMQHIHLLILLFGQVSIHGNNQLQQKKVKKLIHIKIIFNEHLLLANTFNLYHEIHLTIEIKDQEKSKVFVLFSVILSIII